MQGFLEADDYRNAHALDLLVNHLSVVLKKCRGTQSHANHVHTEADSCQATWDTVRA